MRFYFIFWFLLRPFRHYFSDWTPIERRLSAFSTIVERALLKRSFYSSAIFCYRCWGCKTSFAKSLSVNSLTKSLSRWIFCSFMTSFSLLLFSDNSSCYGDLDIAFTGQTTGDRKVSTIFAYWSDFFCSYFDRGIIQESTKKNAKYQENHSV